MQDGVLNLARVKLRDQQRLKHGPLTEYSQYGEGIPFGEAVPRAGNDSGGGQPGWILKCKGWETDPDAYIYFITQAPVWEAICDLIGKPEWKTDPDYATPPARLPRLKHIFGIDRTMDHDQDQVRGHGHLQRARHSGRTDPVDEGDRRGAIAARRPARWSRSIIPTRGKYLTVGNPGEDVGLDHRGDSVRRSRASTPTRSSTKVLGYSAKEIAEIKTSGAITAPEKGARAEAA